MTVAVYSIACLGSTQALHGVPINVLAYAAWSLQLHFMLIRAGVCIEHSSESLEEEGLFLPEGRSKEIDAFASDSVSPFIQSTVQDHSLR